MKIDLERFLVAQESDYALALQEIRQGRKYRHWIWYIFPQLAALGQSDKAKYYGLSGINEAIAYDKHPILGARLREISGALLALNTNDIVSVVGKTDAMKVRSCMTLFNVAVPDCERYQQVLDKFYAGKKDALTLKQLEVDNI